MKTAPLCSLTLVGLVGLLIGATGCKKVGGPSATESSFTPEPTISPIASGEPDSFSKVGKYLDSGGSFYLYLSAEKTLAGLQTKVGEFLEAALAAVPSEQTEQKARVEQIAAVLQGLLRESGIEALSAIGASSVAVEPDLYLNKLFVHHPAGKGDGFVWKMFGQSPHALDALELLPRNTAFGSFADIDLPGLVQFIQKTVEISGQPKAIQTIARLSSTVEFVTGMTLEELTASTGGQWGVILTLDPEETVNFALDEQTHRFPAPRAATLLRVPDDEIFNRVDQFIAKNSRIEKIDEEGLKMRILPISGIPELKLRVTLREVVAPQILAQSEECEGRISVRDF